MNGLRQGCCMAPVLFNLYTCLAVERWQERLDGVAGVGITVMYKYDEKLFRRYTRNACERKVTECQFADDAALLASTRAVWLDGEHSQDQAHGSREVGERERSGTHCSGGGRCGGCG